jgi:DNA-binding transcriptional regulator YiaG
MLRIPVIRALAEPKVCFLTKGMSNMPTSKRKGKRLVELMTPEQCRGARAMLGWSQDVLAERAGVSKPTVTDFERGARTPMPMNLQALRRTLEEGGIEFIDEATGGRGVRFQMPGIAIPEPEAGAE